MSRRKNRGQSKSPNLPEETLERARRQARGEDVNAPYIAPEVEKPKASAQSTTPSLTSSAARVRRKQTKSNDELTPEEVRYLLHNPTKFVDEETLHQEYGYVLKDLRNMGILALLSFVVLIALALVIV